MSIIGSRSRNRAALGYGAFSSRSLTPQQPDEILTAQGGAFCLYEEQGRAFDRLVNDTDIKFTGQRIDATVVFHDLYVLFMGDEGCIIALAKKTSF